MSRFARKLAGLALAALLAIASPAYAQLAVLLPNGQQQFNDANGAPYAFGTVGFYIPTTMTPKTTWIDPQQATPNVNPVVLDAAGRATIYGSGQYREILKDSNGSTIWDKLTYGSGPFPVWGGTSTGTGNAPVVSAGNWVLQNGEQIAWRVGASNTGATSLTIGSNSYSLVADIGAGPTALVGGELITGNIAIGTYDSVLGAIHIGATSPRAFGLAGSVAAGTSTDLGTSGSNNVTVTGTGATINSFGSSASVTSPLYLVKFSGNTNTLTQSASLILPGNASTNVQIGDSLWALYGGSGNWTVLQIMRAGGPSLPVFEQGQLQYSASTIVKLVPFNGNQITFPSGQTATIPNAGISSTITNVYLNGTAAQTLSASTLYYVYIWNQGSATVPNWVLDYSTTGHATDTATGIEIKNGDSTRVLVGMVYPQAGPIFVDSAVSRLVASWSNRKPRALTNSFTTTRTTTSTTYAEINSEIRVNFLSWGDAIEASFAGTASGTTSGTNQTAGPSIDSATSGFPASMASSTNSANISVSGSLTPSEGFHYLTEMGLVASGTLTFTTGNGVGALFARVSN